MIFPKLPDPYQCKECGLLWGASKEDIVVDWEHADESALFLICPHCDYGEYLVIDKEGNILECD